MFKKLSIVLVILFMSILSMIAIGAPQPIGPYYNDLVFVYGDDGLSLNIGISDGYILKVDDADAAVDDYCKLTANGIVGRNYTEVKTDLGIDLSLYYLKTEIDSLSDIEAIYTKNIIDSDELAALEFTDLADTPANYTGSSLKFARVNVGETALEFVAEADPTVDTDAKIKAILVDEVTKTGTFTAGRMAKINNATGIIEQGTNTDTEVADAVTKKHTSGSETQGGDISGTVGNASVNKIKRGLDASKPATPTVGDIYLATDTDKLYKCITAGSWTLLKNLDLSGNNVADLADITSAGASIEDAVTKKHTQNTDTQFDFYNALASDHTWSGDKDTQLVGEPVAFGDLLYPDFAAGKWLKSDADLAAKMPGLRIALEAKNDGEDCLMLVKGYIRDDSAFEFTASMVYASVTPGAMSSTAPTETGDQLQRVGVAKSADILFFDPSIDVGKI